MISETLALADKVSGPSLRMALAVERLEEASDQARKALAKSVAAGGKYGAETAKAVAAVEKQKRAILRMQDAEKRGPALAKAEAAAAKKSAAEAKAAAKAEAAAAKKSADVAKEAAANTLKIGKAAQKTGGEIGELNSKRLLGGLAGPTMGLGILAVAMGIAAVGRAAMGAAQIVAGLVSEFVQGVVAAKLLRDKAQGMQDVLSGGRGAQVLKLLHTQAIRTGQSFDDLAKATEKSRAAGLDYKEAFKLNALRGDLIAVTKSADVADAEIGKALEAVKSGSKTATQAMGELAKKYKVAGDGSKAYEVSTRTLGGALTRLKAASGNLFAKIAEKAGPSLDKLGGKISKMIDEFNASGQAASLVETLAGAMDWMADAVGVAATLIKPLWTGLKEGLGPLGAELKKVGELLGKAFGGKQGTMDGLAVAAQMVGRALGVVVGVAVRVAVGLAAVVTAGAVLFGWLSTLPARASAAAQGMISGLVNGIRDGIGRAVQAVKDLATKLTGAFDFKLKMGSPSKVMQQRGKWTAEGTEEGIYAGLPGVEAASRELAAAPIAAAATGASPTGGATGRGGASSVTINLSVTAGAGATQADGQALAAGIVPVIRREIANWLDHQMASAGIGGGLA